MRGGLAGKVEEEGGEGTCAGTLCPMFVQTAWDVQSRYCVPLESYT